MVLVIENGSLLRSGNALASGLNCCCEPPQSYSTCGDICAFRVAVQDIDSEMAACGDGVAGVADGLPAGWDVGLLSTCNDVNGFYVVPTIFAQRQRSGDCDGYQGIQDGDGFPSSYCRDGEQAGIIYASGFIVGGERVFERNGWSRYSTENVSLDSVQKVFYLYYQIGIYCAPDVPDRNCSVCGGLTESPARAYYVFARMYAQIDESRFSDGVITGSRRSFSGRLGYLPGTVLRDSGRFLSQTCDEMNDFTPTPQYDCFGESIGGCRQLFSFYPPDPLEITLSMDEGVTIGDNTYAWEFVEEVNLSEDFEIEFPGDMKEPGGITVYRAAKCCCKPDYCGEGPLP